MTNVEPTPEMPEETPPATDNAAEIARLQEEVTKLRDQWMRAVAEAENIRKRAAKEMEDTAKYATTAFARDMISVLENLKRASSSIPSSAREGNELLKTIGEGVDLTLNELLGTFERHGIRRLDPTGQKFDHQFHQAVAQTDQTDAAPGTIIQVVQAGYTIHDRLLIPAMVVVAKQSDAPKTVDTSA